MLQITKRADYGLIALTHLAAHPGERVSARALARAYHLSHPLLANVLKALAREEVVRSVRGTKGGYELALPPDALPVGRVVELLEGPLKLAGCVGVDARSPDDEACTALCACPVRHGMLRLHARMRDLLYGVTIADLARGTPGRGPLPLAAGVAAAR